MECLNMPVDPPFAVLDVVWCMFPSSWRTVCDSMGDDEDTKGKSKSVARTVEMVNLSLDISLSRLSRDLLQRFRGSSRDSEEEKGEAADEEVELNLGLSLGGSFGADRSSNPLVRSSSIASCLPVTIDDSDAAAPATPTALVVTLARTASMPVETEEEWRKRKELQSLRRMEAKRRRSEKLRNLRIDKEGIGSGSGGLTMEDRREIEPNLRGRLDREKSLRRSNSSQFRLSDWAGIGSDSAGVDPPLAKEKTGHLVSSGARGSVEPKAGSSSSLSDLESRLMAGSSDEVSPGTGSIQSMQESGNQEAGSSSTKAGEHTAEPDMESPSKRGRRREIHTNSLEDMPCVFTIGDGPNGRRVDGILYKYGKGEEVRIMCICHGTFHAPVDFILHAGGIDVNNPLKHIVVNPNSSSLL